MSPWGAIWRREVAAWAVSPAAYVLAGGFALLHGWFFAEFVAGFVEAGMRMTPGSGFGGTLNVNRDLVRWLMETTALLSLFLLPFVTMRTFAEETRSGTMEMLLTAPVTDGQIVLGKFVAGMTVYAAMLAITVPHQLVLLWFSDPEALPILVGYLGLLLLGAGFLALGMFFSTLTRNQIVAGVLTFGALFLLWVIGFAGQSAGGALARLAAYLSLIGHTENFAQGVVASRDVVFHLSFAIFFLFCCRASLRSRRWRG